MMKLAAFEAMLGTYGAAMRRWPPDRRAAAQALLAHSPQARDMLREAALLDAALDAADPAPVIDDARLGSIVAGALAALPAGAPAPARRSFRPFAALERQHWSRGMPAAWARASGLAACTAAGILVGLVSPLPDQTGSEGTKVETAEGAGTDLATAFVSHSAVESLFQ